MTNYANRWAKNKMVELRAARGNKCDICGEPLVFKDGRPNLQFSHLQPTGLTGPGRGRKERAMDIRKHPTAYRLLCIDCHRENDQLMQEES